MDCTLTITVKIIIHVFKYVQIFHFSRVLQTQKIYGEVFDV